MGVAGNLYFVKLVRTKPLSVEAVVSCASRPAARAFQANFGAGRARGTKVHVGMGDMASLFIYMDLRALHPAAVVLEGTLAGLLEAVDEPVRMRAIDNLCRVYREVCHGAGIRP